MKINTFFIKVTKGSIGGRGGGVTLNFTSINFVNMKKHCKLATCPSYSVRIGSRKQRRIDY